MFGLIDDVVKWLALGKEGRVLVKQFIEERDLAVMASAFGVSQHSLEDVLASLRTKYMLKGLSAEQIVDAEREHHHARIE